MSMYTSLDEYFTNVPDAMLQQNVGIWHLWCSKQLKIVKIVNR